MNGTELDEIKYYMIYFCNELIVNKIGCLSTLWTTFGIFYQLFVHYVQKVFMRYGWINWTSSNITYSV